MATTNQGFMDFVPTLPAGADRVGNIQLPNYYTPIARDGLDLALAPRALDAQLKTIEDNILATQQNQNLSDTQRALTLQQLVNAWNVNVTIETNMTKAIFDALTNIARNAA